jgi:hypothetical protein
MLITETTLDSYATRYIQAWDRGASIKTRSRTRANATILCQDLALFPIKDLLIHPEVAALDGKTLRNFSIFTFRDILEGIAGFEVDVVASLCGTVALKGIGIELPESARQAVLTVATDELYHAFVARELMADIDERLAASHIQPLSFYDDNASETPRLIDPLAFFRQELPVKHRPIADALWLCIAENNLVEELIDLNKNNSYSDNYFHIYVREHLHDEGRHSALFSMLLRHIWAEIDEDCRCVLGNVIVKFFQTYHNDGFVNRGHQRSLHRLGFTPSSSHRIIKEIFGSKAAPRKAELPAAQSALKLMMFAGIFQHEPTRAAMTAAGWLEPVADHVPE